MGEGEFLQIEDQFWLSIKMLVQIAEYPLARSVVQTEVEAVIEVPEVARGEAVEDGLVPIDFRTQIFAASVAGSAILLPVIVEDVELHRLPGLSRLVPPGVLVAQGGLHPAVERVFEPLIALAVVRPAKESDQLVS